MPPVVVGAQLGLSGRRGATEPYASAHESGFSRPRTRPVRGRAEPVRYASSRTHFLFLMPTAYLTLATGGLVF